MIVYKIRDRNTGLFSRGGVTPYWNTVGKIWKKRNHLTTHLGMVYNDGYNRACNPYANADVVQYEITEVEQYTQPTSDWIIDIQAKHHAKEQAHAKRAAEDRRAQRLAEYQTLRAEFEGGALNALLTHGEK